MASFSSVTPLVVVTPRVLRDVIAGVGCFVTEKTLRARIAGGLTRLGVFIAAFSAIAPLPIIGTWIFAGFAALAGLVATFLTVAENAIVRARATGSLTLIFIFVARLFAITPDTIISARITGGGASI